MELLSVLSLFLLTCSTPTSAQQSGPAGSRVVVKEDQQAVLPCSLGSYDITEQAFDWKNAGKEVFFYKNGRHYNNGLIGQDPQFKGRVSHYPEQLASGNASILLRKAEVRDSGNYTCILPSPQPTTQAHVELIVDPILKDRTEEKIPGAVSKPSVKILKQTDDSALLQCVVRGASPKPVVVWKDSSGKVLPAEEPEETEREGKYDIVLQTTVTKSDNYTCEATQEINHQTSDWTNVFFSRAVSKPSVKILKQTDDSALLQCVVRGASPKPVVVWKDSSGKVLPAEEPEETEREGKYDIVLQTTVTKSDNYTCEATQEEIHHQTSDWTLVFFSKKPPPGEDSSGKVPVGVAVGLGVGLVIGLVVGVFVYRWYGRRSRSRVYREAGSSDNRL